MKLVHHPQLRALLAGAAMLSMIAGYVLALVYLTKLITPVVPFAVGGSPYVVGRMFGASMVGSRGQPMVIDQVSMRTLAMSTSIRFTSRL